MLVKRGSDFAGRPLFYRLEMWSDFQSFQDGIVFANPDSTWKMLRQLAHKHNKQYDKGLKRIEDVSLEVNKKGSASSQIEKIILHLFSFRF